MKPRGAKPQANREHNRAVILTLIRNFGPISRVEIARKSGLSKPVVTEIVTSLINTNLVFESHKAEATKGRRRVMLDLRRDNLRTIGVDLSRNGIECMVTDLTGKCVKKVYQPMSAETPGITPLLVEDAVCSAIREAGVESADLIGIGVGYPFPLFSPGSTPGLVVGEDAPEGFERVHLKERLMREFSVPVFLDNDANAAALYETWYGMAADFKDFLYVMIGQGVGLGIFSDDKLLRGRSGIAGEWGHIVSDPDGRQCVCGKRGCLETEISLSALLQELSSETNGVIHDLGSLVRALSEDDPIAMKQLTEYSIRLGRHVGNLVSIFNPEAVIIGGQLGQIGRFIIDRLRESVEETVHPLMRRSCTILFSDTTENRVAKGGSILVQQHFFAHPHEYIPDLSRGSIATDSQS